MRAEDLPDLASESVALDATPHLSIENLPGENLQSGLLPRVSEIPAPLSIPSTAEIAIHLSCTSRDSARRHALQYSW